MVYTTYKLVYMDIFTDGCFDNDFKKNYENVNFYELVRSKYYLQRLVNLLKWH